MPGLEAAVETLFGEGGALSTVDARFERRPQQAAMGLAVAEALERGETLVVEAGTGVGKSLGYLLPAALWAVENGRRVMVSTYTRALQEQIVEKDLPAAARALAALGKTLRYSMLQGADNYLCVQRLSRLREQPKLFGESGAPRLDELAAWARTAESGHRSKLPSLVPHALWAKVSRDPDLCLGPNGRFWGQCLYRKDRERADRSHVVVVNHALLLSGGRLPPYDALVIDEAHSLEESAVGRFGVAVSAGRVQRALEELRAASAKVPELEAPADLCAAEFPAFLAQTALEHGRAGDEPGGSLLAEKVQTLEPPALVALEGAVARALEKRSSQDEAKEDEALTLRLAHGRLAGLRSDLRYILEQREEDVARWVEWHGGGVSLHAAPLDVGQRLGEGLLGRGVPVVLTSATLDSGEGLRGFKTRLGLAGARELKLDSPFDYPTQAGLLVQDDLPAPADARRYPAALARRCKEIADRVPGGLFILFSSWKTLRAVHARLRRTIKDRPLWMQGEAGNDALLAEFAEAGNAVLLGVDTFWQGVDVPGDALSCVVLTKLPFPNFGSPVEEARRRWFESMGRSYFSDHSLPRAVMRFRQGFGRLIRGSDDRGAVVVLDSRLAKKGYGNAFLEALPRCRTLKDLDDLKSFFEEKREKPDLPALPQP